MEFYCALCQKSFVSGYSLAEHFRSKEHKTAAGEGRIDSLLNQFVDILKKSGSKDDSGSSKV